MKLVEVEWIDSMGESGWQPAEDARRQATEDAMRHRSVGYVLADKDHSLLIAQSCGDSGDDDTRLVGHTLQIPRSAIAHVRGLRR